MLGISWFELHQLQDTSDCITCVILLFCVQVTLEAVFIMLPLVSCRGISICAGATCDTLCARWHQVIHVTPCQSSHPHTCTILHASVTYISKLVVQGVILQNQMHTLLTHQACGAAVHLEEHTYSRLLAVLIIVVFMVSVLYTVLQSWMIWAWSTLLTLAHFLECTERCVSAKQPHTCSYDGYI